MSKQQRQAGVRANRRDVKGWCGKDRKETDRSSREGSGAEVETKYVEEFNESPAPLNYTTGAG